MPEPIQSAPAPQLTTKTKTRTKAVVATLVVIVGLGIIAAVGAVRGRRAGECNSGSLVRQSCRTNRECRVAPSDRDAQCVRASTATSSRSTSRSRSTSGSSLPDLVVSSISPNPITGITTVEIQNRGRGAASAFNVSLSAFVSRTDDRLLVEGSARLEGLAAGASTSISVLLYPEGSTLPGYPSTMGGMKAYADFSHEITESDATNNVLIITIPPPAPTPALPDLASSFSVERKFPGQYDNVKYKFIIADPEGVSYWLATKTDGSSTGGGEPPCLTSMETGVVSLFPSDFPLTVTIRDCNTPGITSTFTVPMPPLSLPLLRAALTETPAGTIFPGRSTDVLKFRLTASGGEINVRAFLFEITSTDNDGLGSSGGDWNTWRTSAETFGIENLQLLDLYGLTTPLPEMAEASFGFYAGAEEQYALIPSLDRASSTAVRFVSITPSRPLVIPDGVSRSFELRMNTTGANEVLDDTLRVDLVQLGVPPEPPSRPLEPERQGFRVEGLPLIGGALVF